MVWSCHSAQHLSTFFKNKREWARVRERALRKNTSLFIYLMVSSNIRKKSFYLLFCGLNLLFSIKYSAK